MSCAMGEAPVADRLIDAVAESSMRLGQVHCSYLMLIMYFLISDKACAVIVDVRGNS